MIFGLLPVNFRFRGKVGRLTDIYRCFLDHPGVGLHPTQIARHTGISFAEVNVRLQRTPELFVKLPKRADGITRYRLTSSTAAQSQDDVEAFLASAARKETLVLYSVGAMILCLLLIIVILIGPAV
ncbi:MAG: hypothetical protein KF911_15715 [Pseudomonadales bacterium]|nr:hypothetical protein [Pseudomonadales bacterium]